MTEPSAVEVDPRPPGRARVPGARRRRRGASSLGALADEPRSRRARVLRGRVLRTPFGKAVRARLEREAPLALVARPAGRRARRRPSRELERAAGALLEAGATRRSLVVALGGGAVTDAAGFLAATYMRGIPWAAVPTTLLAMVDAAIGGKTAVNLPVAKNAVGAFHPPEAVLADPAALDDAARARAPQRQGRGAEVRGAPARAARGVRAAARRRDGRTRSSSRPARA